MNDVPKYNELMWPALRAVKALGGSASNAEILEKVIELERIPEAVQNVIDKPGRTKLEYRLAWARSYLKYGGALTNSERGVWSLTSVGANATEKDVEDFHAKAKARSKARSSATKEPASNTMVIEEDDEVQPWKSELLETIQSIEPDAFERLCQRIMREAGFVEVEVTGQSGDGGIDGFGILRINLLSFKVIFQSKRYAGSVGPDLIRDFRGAMQGRAEKGLFITTGTFTASSRKEARREGAPPIDLIDGDDLCDLLKKYRLGTAVEQIEKVTVLIDWFKSI